MKADLKLASDSTLTITASDSLLEQLLKNPDSFKKGLKVEGTRIFYPVSDSEAPIEVGVVKKHFLKGHYTLYLENNNIGREIHDRLRRSY